VIVDYSELHDNGTAIDNLTFVQELPSTSAALGVDTDDDGIPDDEDTDDDNDGVPDVDDAFPLDPNESVDTDGDGTGDNADTDDDAFPLDPSESTDSDGDGVGDNADAFPDDPDEWADENKNGIGDNSEADSGSDGFTDGEELASGSDPDDPDSIPSAQAIKGLVLASLDPFVDESKKIGKAVREITRSLEQGWLDDGTLDPKKGKKVFDRQKKAAKELQKAIDGHKNEVLSDEASAAANDAIARLVAESRSLVGADDLAGLTALDPKKQDKVDREIAKVAKELAKGDAALEDRPNKAIGYYKKAWQHAEHAEKHAAKAPKPPKEPKPPKAPKDDNDA
jgi:hypothetical protein